MVKTLLSIVLLATGTANAASLSAQLDNTDVALGESVSLTVQAQGLPLDALDIAPLVARFDVFSRTLSRSADSETLVLTLYPRMTGSLRIPMLHVDALHTAALSMKVTDGSDSVPRVTASWRLEPGAPHVNQPTRLTLAICDDGSLQWQRPVLPATSGRLLRALGEDEGKGERAGEPCTLHQYFWSLIATQGGAASLRVSMLDASHFGQRLRFPGTDLAYQATELPAWLPAHVPPVAPSVRTDPLPARWPLQRPLSWRFHVTGGYSAEGLKALLDMQLRESMAFGGYPPLIEEAVQDDASSPLSRYDVTLYFLPRETGQISLPTVRLPWYDLSRGQLASTELAGKSLTIFDPRWKLGGQIAGGLAGLLLLGGLLWQARHMTRWRLARRRGLRAIRQARDVGELVRAVRQFSMTGQAAAPSLGEWQHRMQQDTGTCDVAEAVRQLEQQQFGQACYSLAALRQAFLQVLARARPKRPHQKCCFPR
jgi:hypothetical protein